MGPPKRRTVRPAKKPRAKTSASAKASKLDRIIRALSTPKGATIDQLTRLTGWQKHSIRGAIAGGLKKRRGLIITSKKVGDTRIYLIEAKP